MYIYSASVAIFSLLKYSSHGDFYFDFTWLNELTNELHLTARDLNAIANLFIAVSDKGNMATDLVYENKSHMSWGLQVTE